jgi:SulP family sulfate permease
MQLVNGLHFNNIRGDIYGGLPGAGATMRTVVNVNAGGRTPISGALHAVVLLAIVLGAGTLASNIPKAVLAGILIKVGTDIIDWDYLKRIPVAPKAGVLIMCTVLIITVTIDLLLAVGIGMIMASFLFMHRMTEMQIANISTIKHPGKEIPLSEEEQAIMG